MYREVIEHPLSLPPVIKKHLDLTSGRDRGRIWRIAPDGFQRRKLPRLHEAGGEELVVALAHPNGWHRDTAARLLYERQDTALVPAVEKLAAACALPQGRMQALYTLAGWQRLAPGHVLKALRDDHPRVREHAVRLAERFPDNAAVAAALQALAETETDVRVLYQLAFSLGEFDGKAAGLARLARRQADDAWIRLAVQSSLAGGAGAVFSELAGDAEYRRSISGKQMLAALAHQIGLAQRRDDLAAVLDWLKTLPKEEMPLAAAVVRQLGDGLARSGSPLRQTLAAAGTQAAQILDAMLRDARATALDWHRPPQARAEAARTLGLGELGQERAVLEQLLSNRQPHEVQLAALAALSRFTSRDVAAIVLAGWSSYSPQVRSAAMELLFARPQRVAALLDAIEAGHVPAGDLDSSRIQQLRQFRDTALRERAEKLLATALPARRQEVVEAYRQALSLAGDRARGRELFKKNCAACHRVEGVGTEIGPNLIAMQNRGPEAILVNVLDPNREVNPQFVNYVVQTDDGRSLTGLISAETATSVTLLRAEGQTDTVLRINIELLQSTGLSIMPEGLEKQLDPQALADVIAYLMGAK
jgi:putative heme-binding domain-containing protein